jgi:hypothetical protein
VLNDTEDLAKAINAVLNLMTKSLEGLIKQYDSIVKAELIDRENDDLIGVGAHLRSIMMEKLTIEFNRAIYQGFFGGDEEASRWVPLDERSTGNNGISPGGEQITEEGGCQSRFPCLLAKRQISDLVRNSVTFGALGRTGLFI